jgi:hypothetical protein
MQVSAGVHRLPGQRSVTPQRGMSRSADESRCRHFGWQRGFSRVRRRPQSYLARRDGIYLLARTAKAGHDSYALIPTQLQGAPLGEKLDKNQCTRRGFAPRIRLA